MSATEESLKFLLNIALKINLDKPVLEFLGTANT